MMKVRKVKGSECDNDFRNCTNMYMFTQRHYMPQHS